ncbi:BESS domain-containing protein, partial [Aphis craccivora]
QNLQRKWKSLRNSYAREQSKRKTMKSGSGSKSWKTYVYYNQLSFLSTCVGNKQTISNFNDDDAEQYADAESNTDNEDNDNMNDSGEEHAYEDTITQSRQSKKTKTQNKDSESQLLLSIQKSLENRNEMTKSMDDPDRLFLLSLINDLKQVPEENKMEVQLSIMQTISNAKKSRQQNTHFSDGSYFDTQCQLNSTLHQYPTLYQRPQAYPNFQSLYPNVHPLQNNQHQRFRTPTPSSSQNILSNTEVDVSQSSSSSLASYVSQFNDTI